MNKSDLVTIRSYLPTDKNFIYASWLRGLYYGDSWYSEVNKQAFMENYHKVLDILLAKPTTVIAVACLKEEPEVILGYSVSTPVNKSISWVFVKKNWRGIGIGKDLTPPETQVATHATRVGLSILKTKGWILNPFLI